MSRWLLGGAGFLAFLHASGELLGRPIFRYAEVLALVALLAAAHVRGLPSPRWALPVGFGALIVDALLSLPEPPSQQFLSLNVMPSPSAFELGMRLTWAPFLFAMAVLIVSFPLPRRLLPFVLGAVVVGYAIGIVILSHHGDDPGFLLTGSHRQTGAVMPVIMGLGAAALAFRSGPPAVALTVAALLHIDDAVGSSAGLSALIPSTTTLPGSVAALTTALEVTACLLIVAGLNSRAPVPVPDQRS